MKLPDLQYSSQVPTLGRQDPGEIVAAAAAWRSLINNAIATGANLYQEMEKRDAVAEYNRLEGEAKKDFADLEAKLSSKSAFSPDEIPDGVDFKDTETVLDEHGNATEQFRESIPGDEIRLAWYNLASKEIESKYSDQAVNKIARRKILDEIRSNMSPAGYSSVVQFTMKEMLDGQYKSVETAVDSAIANTDAAGADRLLIRAKVAGIINTSEYTVLRAKAQQDIDRNMYMNQVQDANSKSALDNLHDKLVSGESLAYADKNTTMTYEQRNHLFGLIESKKAEIESRRKDNYDYTARQGVRLFLKGELSDEWLDKNLANNNLDDATARALIGMKTTVTSTNIKDASKVARYKSYIKSMIYPAEDGSVTNTARVLRRELMEEARTGSINGEELDVLLDEVDSTQKSVTDNPAYKETMALIKSHGGISDFMAPDPGPRTWAYNAFTNALYQYVDRAGAAADPIKFYNENKDKFTPEMFENGAAERYVTIYPEYNAPPFYREIEQGDKRSFVFDTDRIASDLMKKYKAGQISRDELMFRWIELRGAPPDKAATEMMQ